MAFSGSGPLPIGNAAVHSGQTRLSNIPIGVGLNPLPVGNQGDVPNTDSPSSTGFNREALGDSAKPDESLKKASKTAA